MSGCGMSEKPETTEDIIAEMRDFADKQEKHNFYDCRHLGTDALRGWADIFDAANKREVDALNEQIADLRQQRDLWSKRAAELVEKCNEHYAKLKQVGSAAKLRDALVQVQKKINYLIGNLTVPNSLVANRMEINGIINAALAAPPRNCDVGSAEEQAKRLHRFCISQDCETCPCNLGKADGRCEFAWMQMPYKEGGAK